MEKEARLLKAEATASLELAQERIRQVEKRSERMLKEAMEGVLARCRTTAINSFIGLIVS